MYVLFDRATEVVSLLLEAHKEFMPKEGVKDTSYLDEYPAVNAHALAPVGAMGFRWATQIDPFWNAYLLGLVLSVGERIEQTRLPIVLRTVFSYRFRPDPLPKPLTSSGIGRVPTHRNATGTFWGTPTPKLASNPPSPFSRSRIIPTAVA